MAESTKNMTVGAGSASASVTATVTDQMPGVPCPATPGYTYTGMRYVPVFADPAEWSSANSYEPLEIVIHKGNSYTSKTFVPVGIDISDPQYWALTGNYNAQIEQYRRDVAELKENAVVVPEAFGATEGGDSTAAIAAALASGFAIDGRGRTYNVTSVTASAAVTLSNITLNCTAANQPRAMLTIARGSRIQNCKLVGNALCDYTLETVANARGSYLPATVIFATEIMTGFIANVFAGSAVIVDDCKLSMSEAGLTGSASDCKVYGTVFYNCRSAIKYVTGMGGMEVDNVHAWVTRRPSDSPLYKPKQDNTAYPGTSCMFDLLAKHPSLRVGSIYVDTLTYCLNCSDSSIVQSYALIEIVSVNFFINTSFYTTDDPQPLFMNGLDPLYKTATNHVSVVSANLDFNGLLDDTAYYPNYFPLNLTINQETIFQVGMQQYKSMTPLIDNYCYSTMVANGAATGSVGTPTIWPSIIKSGNRAHVEYRAGLTEAVQPGGVIATITFANGTSQQPEINAQFIDTSTGKYTPLEAAYANKTLTLTNGSDSAIQSGVVRIY